MLKNLPSYVPANLLDDEIYTLILPLVNYMLGYSYPDSDKLIKRFDDITNKYKDVNALQSETLSMVLNEQGYGYISDILSLSKDQLANILGFLSLIQFFKGSRYGYETVLRLLELDFKVKEWWEFQPRWEKNTFSLELYLRSSNNFQYADLDKLLTFTRNYVYPLCYTKMYHVADLYTYVAVQPLTIEYGAVYPEVITSIRQTLAVRLDVGVNIIEKITVYPKVDLNPPNNTVPNVPTNLQASFDFANPMQINLAWIDNSSNETSFEVKITKPDNTAETQITPANFGGTIIILPVGSSEGNYTFEVRSYNAGGYSGYCPPSTLTFSTPVNIPSSPVITGVKSNFNSTYDYYQISWQSTGADSYELRGSSPTTPIDNVISYYGSNTTQTALFWVLKNNLGAYQYKLYAIKDGVYSEMSNILSPSDVVADTPQDFSVSIDSWSGAISDPYSIPIITANWTNVPGVQWVVTQFRETTWMSGNWSTWSDISNTTPPPSTVTQGWVWNRGNDVSFRLYCSNGKYSNVSTINIP